MVMTPVRAIGVVGEPDSPTSNCYFPRIQVRSVRGRLGFGSHVGTVSTVFCFLNILGIDKKL